MASQFADDAAEMPGEVAAGQGGGGVEDDPSAATGCQEELQVALEGVQLGSEVLETGVIGNVIALTSGVVSDRCVHLVAFRLECRVGRSISYYGTGKAFLQPVYFFLSGNRKIRGIREKSTDPGCEDGY